MSALAETPYRFDRRPSRQAQRGCAGGGAGAGRRQQHSDRGDRRHHRPGSRARQKSRHLADLGDDVRALVQHGADGLAGAQLRPPLRAADRHRWSARSSGLVCCVAVLQGSFRAAAARHLRLRILCGGAHVVSLRVDRHGERCLQADRDLLRSGRRCAGRRDRPFDRDLHQGSCGRPICSPRRSSLSRCLAVARRAGADRSSSRRRRCRASGDRPWPAAGRNRAQVRNSSWPCSSACRATR